jgi:hypothetical protein
MLKIEEDEEDDNEQERYLNYEKIHSLVRDSYSPLGVIIRREEKKTVN